MCSSDLSFIEAHTNLLFAQSYQLDPQGAASRLADAKAFGHLVSLHARAFGQWQVTAREDRPLRIGLVSGDFRQHPVGHFLEAVLPQLAALPAPGLQLFAYSNSLQADPLTARLRTACQGWCDVAGLSDERLARQIHDDRIDILVDLSGHTGHGRLPVFAWKAAPVQVTWLGYWAKIGRAHV